jgi:hypothetical protein
MVIVGIKEGVIDLCVSITPDQLATVQEMYPAHLLLEQAGAESIGWLFDGVGFIDPASV